MFAIDLVAQEVPGPGQPNGTAFSQLTLNSKTGQVCYVILARDLKPLTAAHIHRGAAGTAGPVVVPFTLTKEQRSSGIASGCMIVLDRARVQAIIDNPANFYTNVHNAPFPGGAARGQLELVTRH